MFIPKANDVRMITAKLESIMNNMVDKIHKSKFTSYECNMSLGELGCSIDEIGECRHHIENAFRAEGYKIKMDFSKVDGEPVYISWRE